MTAANGLRDSNGALNARYHLPSEFPTTKNLIGAPGLSRSRRPWWKNLIDQAIIRSLEWVDESDALQHEPILQIFSEQTRTPARCAEAHNIASQNGNR
jgi:hypothetical protein